MTTIIGKKSGRNAVASFSLATALLVTIIGATYAPSVAHAEGSLDEATLSKASIQMNPLSEQGALQFVTPKGVQYTLDDGDWCGNGRLTLKVPVPRPPTPIVMDLNSIYD